MTRRPWSIVMLAVFHWIAPIFSLFLNSWIGHESIRDVFHHVNSLSPREIFEFWALMPLAGFAILAVRWWSYPVVILSTLWMAVSNTMTWRQTSEQIPLWILIILLICDIAVVAYLLIPQVRLVYFNPRVRWWEHHPRYAIRSDAEVFCGAQGWKCVMVNLSKGGCFLDLSHTLKVGETVDIVFPVYSASLRLKAEVLRVGSAAVSGYGLRFIHTPETLNRIKQLIKALDGLKIDRNPAYVSGLQNYGQWIKNVVTRGKGLVPEIPELYANANSSDRMKK